MSELFLKTLLIGLATYVGSDFTIIHEDIGMPNEHLHVQLKQRG